MAAALAARISRATSQPVAIDGLLLPMSASIGISMYPADASNPSGLLRAADHAM